MFQRTFLRCWKRCTHCFLTALKLHWVVTLHSTYKACVCGVTKVEPTSSSFRNHCDNVKVVKHIHPSVCIMHFSGQTSAAKRDDKSYIAYMSVDRAEFRAKPELKFEYLIEVLNCSVVFMLNKVIQRIFNNWFQIHTLKEP